MLEQYGAPEELLRRPANAFVEEFLGEERGLKRMALLKVADVELTPGAVVAPGATPQEAKAVMDQWGFDWIGVLDGTELLGWVAASDLDGVSTVGEADRGRFRAAVRPDTALREALDRLVTSETRVAVVFDDDDRYLGMLTIDQISEGVR